MRLVGDCTYGEGGGQGKVVVVGVKFDGESRELLTWALVKVAQPGDRIIALHVLDTITESTGSLLSLVKTFDSMLSVYEGFCNLKQVDLKLKVCRGTSVKKIIVKEAKSYGEAKVIVGISKTHRTIRSSVSVAKYCARKLSKNFGVFAVENGKIVFQREATHNLQDDHVKVTVDDADHVPGECTNCDSRTQSCEELAWDETVADNSLALVPVQTDNSLVVRESPRSKQEGWPFLRRVFLPKHQDPEKTSAKKTSLIQWVLRLPSRYTSAVVYPDHKQNHSADTSEDNRSNLDGESGAIVSVEHDSACPPLSPYNELPKELEGLQERYSSTCRLFSYQELLSATSNFLPENLVGKGGHSHVYRGCLPDGKELAVKILKPSEDVLKEFASEIEIITALHHRNIISLFGFCFEDNNLLLVYDFLSRGSLEENLHGKYLLVYENIYRYSIDAVLYTLCPLSDEGNKKDGNVFGWTERYKVAVGVAEALDYLHNSCEQPVIHKDVKSSNILLSDDFEPQVSYLAPEYFMHGKVSEKIDVYAFGIVLLELLSGKKPINSENPKGQESLVMWAKPILKDGKVSQLLDPSLDTDYDNDQIERMVLAATLSISRAPTVRPQINLVLKLLQGDEEAANWAKEQVSASEELDSIDGEASPTNIQSHLNLALLDLDDDSVSAGSTQQIISVEDYLQGRWSRTSSFD
ncbi:protein kinase domain-containing protein [Citrus sinensis]|uniref:Protein kinase domain-containing protein n=1 Tax=Citrus sinensis TaxID=2711 RepID=A0ACB8JHY4_CITSI|nr:protein kinase domain-containing protein [Citrus sinensis]